MQAATLPPVVTLAPFDTAVLPPPAALPHGSDPSLDLAPLRLVVDDAAHGMAAAQLLPQHTLEPISRPSSASTQASLAQLPGFSSFVTGTDAAHSSPQPKAMSLAATAMARLSSVSDTPPLPPLPPAAALQQMQQIQQMQPRSSPAATHTGGLAGASNPPICQNCATSTTPLWRRDEMGSVLCNACGLFLKLHGRPRPISLKTDVIKSRNRVKTSMRPDMAMKKKNAAAVAAAGGVDANGVVDLQSQAYAATAALTARRTSQKSANGHLDGTDGSLGGQGMYGAHTSGSYPMLDDGQYQGQHLQAFGASGTSPSRALSPVSGDRLDGPQSQDQLVAANSSLKTRVAELEVINDFIQRRLGHYEPPYGSGGQDGQDANHQAVEAQLRSQVELLTQSETQLRSQLEESHRRENMLKRRLDELELELKDSKESLGAYESGRAKKPRLESPADNGVASADAAVNGDDAMPMDAPEGEGAVEKAADPVESDAANAGSDGAADETAPAAAEAVKEEDERASEASKTASPKP